MAAASSFRRRNHTNYWAFALHRFSGVALALFLPVHFWVLALALKNLNQFLIWTHQPLVQAAEGGLVFLLALHLVGGLRVLALEFLPWHNWQKTAVAVSGGVSLAVALIFLLNLT
jgi:fumarate reductase subunit D